MSKKNLIGFIFILIFLLLIIPVVLLSQTQTVGLFINDTALTYKGYTLMAPKLYTATYLINNEGRLIHKWSNSQYPPGQSVYLLPNGNLLRSCMIPGYINAGGGEGGRIEEYTWGDTLVWQFEYATQNYQSHHDIRRLPNGNILLLAVEKKTLSQLSAAGFDPSKYQPEISTRGYMLPDYVIEVQPAYPSGGNIVWEWHVWDHLVQDYDSTKSNYGVVANHAELIDADGDGRQLPCFWNHMNSIAYNAKFDQIILSVRGNSEVWVIDHSTTTTQAAGHTGGRYGKGGDLLYRWGNPVCYKMGNASNQKLFEQHDAEWIDSTYPGTGNITAFNNGVNRNYSTIDEFTPPVDSLGFYFRAAGTAFGPASLAWTYSATPPASMYSWAISGAQRLPNGNTLICDGIHGNFLEVTYSKQLIWKYINPVINTGPLYQGDSIPQDPTHPGEYMNMVFRVQRYSPTYPGLVGRDLTPGNFIELYHSGIGGEFNNSPASYSLSQNYPNPFNPTTKIHYDIPKSSFVKLEVFDVLGREVETLVNEKKPSGSYQAIFNASHYPSGVYLYKLTADGFINVKRMILVK
ncbi:MAG: aryl-sulfate sulfotransferase [Ignavibacteriae bacterium]|nr:aryl-sulfate sulfotransferase [Ignavibacteriota bacterium]